MLPRGTLLVMDPSLAQLQPLRRAERILLDAYRAGRIARIGMRRPLVPSPEIAVRGEFVRLLAVGGGGATASGRGLQMVGAWIEGRVDLRDAVVPDSLWFYRCVFDATPRLERASVDGSISFRDCLLPGLRAESCRISEELALNSGCTVRAEVRLAGANIGGDLNCERLRLRSSDRSSAPSRRRLSADGARIDGDAILTEGFEADGNVRLVGVHIGGSLRAHDARISGNLDDAGQRGDSLTMDRARVDGDVTLAGGFAVAGPVRLRGARIRGDLDCTGAAFDVFGELSWAEGATLLLEHTKVRGSLLLARLRNPLHAASLAGVRVGALLDDASTWGERLVLDDFHYTRLAPGAPAGAPFRINWLAAQEADHLGKDFRPGPWQQLIAVLRRMGHDHGAQAIAIERERRLHRIGRVGAGAPWAWRWLARLGHRALGLLAGYGYRPARIVVAAVLLWLACGALYSAAADRGAIVAAEPTPHGAAQPSFRPWVYSADIVVPLLDLGEERRWTPHDGVQRSRADTAAPSLGVWGDGVRLTGWLQGLLGWIASLTFIAALAGLFDRDRRAS